MTTLPSKFEMKCNIHYCLLFFFFFSPSFLHAIDLGLECVSAKTLGVVLAGKGRQVLGRGDATQIRLHCLFMHRHKCAIREAIQ